MRALDQLREAGIRRAGTPRAGFRYLAPGGRPVAASEAARIRALSIPPAWTDVHVSPLPAAKLQAIGRDRAGRWQYRYHPAFAARRASAKYRRLLRFAAALPRLRAAVERDLRRRDLSRERVLAAMVRIVERCHMRPGSAAYARENGSFGLTTVRPRHVEVRGDLVVFDYRGKSGQRQVRELRDRRIARLVRELLRVPCRDAFKFVANGEVVDVRRRHLNAYIREAAGAPFTAKDFRTWAGTLLCAVALARAQARAAPREPSARAARRRLRSAASPGAGRKRIANAVVKEVAARLGNTPAVARASYVSPAVLGAFARGRVVACGLDADALAAPPRAGLSEAERALLAFLRAGSGAPRRAPALRLVRGGSRAPGRMRPTGATAKPLRRAARAAERE